ARSLTAALHSREGSLAKGGERKGGSQPRRCPRAPLTNVGRGLARRGRSGGPPSRLGSGAASRLGRVGRRSGAGSGRGSSTCEGFVPAASVGGAWLSRLRSRSRRRLRRRLAPGPRASGASGAGGGSRPSVTRGAAARGAGGSLAGADRKSTRL